MKNFIIGAGMFFTSILACAILFALILAGTDGPTADYTGKLEATTYMSGSAGESSYYLLKFEGIEPIKCYSAPILQIGKKYALYSAGNNIYSIRRMQ
jgi:hypothetical protein